MENDERRDLVTALVLALSLATNHQALTTPLNMDYADPLIRAAALRVGWPGTSLSYKYSPQPKSMSRKIL